MSKKVPLCSDSAVQLRFLCPEDLEEVKQLCTEWFPIEYPDSWYRDVTSNPKFFSLAAIYNHSIIGLVIAEIKPFLKCNKEDQGILSLHFPSSTQVAYILSLGVMQDYRRNGIASLLLDNLISHLTSADNTHCKVIYLHVLTTNVTAIRFYEQRHFQLHSYLPYYYSIQGIPKDGYSYVLYLNGGHPPWNIIDYIKYTVQTVGFIQPCNLMNRMCRGMRWIFRRMMPGVGRIVQSVMAVLS